MLTTKEEILNIFRNFITDSVVIDNRTSLEDLNMDSFTLIQFIVDIETRFNIEVTDDKLDISEYHSCFELIEYIYGLIN